MSNTTCVIIPDPQGNLLTYSITNENEWGRVIIDETRNMIMCHTGIGEYCCSWRSPGTSFLKFLIELGFEYTMSKILGNSGLNLKIDKTVLSMKEHIISYRLDGSYTKEDARDMWDNLLEAAEEQSNDAFYNCIRDGSFSTHCNDWWEFGVYGYHQDTYDFWRLIWEPIMIHIKNELNEGRDN